LPAGFDEREAEQHDHGQARRERFTFTSMFISFQPVRAKRFQQPIIPGVFGCLSHPAPRVILG
jgi:hypothetical protein